MPDRLCRLITERAQRSIIMGLGSGPDAHGQLLIYHDMFGLYPRFKPRMAKVFAGELMERFGEAALDLLGQAAALSSGSPGAVQDGRFEQRLRHSLMWVISIGTNEIQRSLIAQRGLGLPR